MYLYRTDLKVLARRLRSEMTPAERVLWSRLRRKQVLGLSFYRQKPIGSVIVDFFCPKAKLVVEVDGGYHGREEQALDDRRRDEELRRAGLTSLRFTNEEVLTETEAVVREIKRVAQTNLTPDRDAISREGRGRPPLRKGGPRGDFSRESPSR